MCNEYDKINWFYFTFFAFFVINRIEKRDVHLLKRELKEWETVHRGSISQNSFFTF